MHLPANSGDRWGSQTKVGSIHCPVMYRFWSIVLHSTNITLFLALNALPTDIWFTQAVVVMKILGYHIFWFCLDWTIQFRSVYLTKEQSTRTWCPVGTLPLNLCLHFFTLYLRFYLLFGGKNRKPFKPMMCWPCFSKLEYLVFRWCELLFLVSAQFKKCQCHFKLQWTMSHHFIGLLNLKIQWIFI